MDEAIASEMRGLRDIIRDQAVRLDLIGQAASAALGRTIDDPSQAVAELVVDHAQKSAALGACRASSGAALALLVPP